MALRHGSDFSINIVKKFAALPRAKLAIELTACQASVIIFPPTLRKVCQAPAQNSPFIIFSSQTSFSLEPIAPSLIPSGLPLPDTIPAAQPPSASPPIPPRTAPTNEPRGNCNGRCRTTQSTDSTTNKSAKQFANC